MCDTCLSNFFGDSCSPCPSCANGACADGKTGSGACNCASGFQGLNCSDPITSNGVTLEGGAVAGIIIGIIAFVALIVGGVAIYLKTKDNTHATKMEREEHDLSSKSPESSGEKSGSGKGKSSASEKKSEKDVKSESSDVSL